MSDHERRRRTAGRPARARLLAGLLVAALLTACGTGPPDHVRIGVVVPLSGPRADLGQQVLDGARLAVEDLDAAGGLLGSPVELVVVDDADLIQLPGQLATLAERSRVTAVVGPEAAGVVLGERSPLTRRDVPALLPTAFTGDLSAASTEVRRLVPSARAQAATIGRWLTEVRNVTTAAVLVADDIEGERAAEEVAAALADEGVDVAAVRAADPGAARLDPAVAALRDAAGDARALVVWAPPAPAARATLAARRIGWDVQLVVPSSSFVAEYRTIAGEASEGVVLAFPYRPEWFGPRLTSLMVRYHRDRPLGALPGLDTLVLDVPVLALAGYDAVLTVAAAVEEAGSRAPDAVAEAFDEITVDGLLRTYGAGAEAWTPDDLYVARFHRFATVFDADPRLDRDEQRTFFQRQVAADYLPPEVLDGPAGGLLRSLLESARSDLPEYEPPVPGPAPVATP